MCIWLISNMFQLIESEILNWKVYILIEKTCFNLTTCMPTDIKWSDRKMFVLNKNIYILFEQYVEIENIYAVEKNIS